MRILFIDTVHPALQQGLERVGHVCVDASGWSREEILRQCGDAAGMVIRSRIRIDRELLDAATSLKFIARAGAGMESIDVAYAEVKGVRCLNSPEGNRDAVGEHALGMLLMLLNNLGRADRQVRSGSWQREPNRGTELGGKTVGLLGYGNMGGAFARKLVGFDCEVLAYDKYRKNYSDPYAREADLFELYESCDVLSLHVPLAPDTEYLVNTDFLSRFRKPIVLVNTARGKCVRTDDLVAAMKAGKVTGACLDVMEYEDLSFEKFDPKTAGFLDSETWQYLSGSDRVVLSPHIAGWSYESHRKISEVLLEKVLRLLPG
jgi:D-3-phosphoglycerate dehydrogenase